MKSILLITLTLITCRAYCAGVDSLEDLRASIQKAIATKDTKIMEALTFTEGMSEEDKAQRMVHYRDYLFSVPANNIEFGPSTSEHEKPFRVHIGVKYTPTLKPIGTVIIHHKSDRDSSRSMLPYGKSSNLFYLVGVRSEKINWQGPPDKSIGWSLHGNKLGLHDFKYKYNTSGEIVNDISDYPNSSFYGQNIIEVSFTSDMEDFEGYIVIYEGGNEVARSEAFRGSGIFVYKIDGAEPALPEECGEAPRP